MRASITSSGLLRVEPDDGEGECFAFRCWEEKGAKLAVRIPNENGGFRLVWFKPAEVSDGGQC